MGYVVPGATLMQCLTTARLHSESHVILMSHDEIHWGSKGECERTEGENTKLKIH